MRTTPAAIRPPPAAIRYRSVFARADLDGDGLVQPSEVGPETNSSRETDRFFLEDGLFKYVNVQNR